VQSITVLKGEIPTGSIKWGERAEYEGSRNGGRMGESGKESHELG
jgi:hypothetical protein